MNSVNRSVFPSLNRICDYVEYYAHVDPQREALVLGDVRYDYRKFNELTDRAGSALANLGLKAGDRVAGMITPRPEFAILLMAALRNGLIWVGINPRYTSREIQYILDDAKPSLLFSITSDLSGRDFEDDLRSCRDDSPFLRKIITIPESIPDLTERWGDFLSSVSADASTARRVQPEANSEHSAEPAVIVYTSGTTGNPKGALLSHDNLIYSFDSVSRSFAGKDELRVGMRTLCNLPTNHIGCISELVGNTLICGGTLVFAERFNAAEVLRIIEAERINQFGGVPLMLEQIFSQLDLTQTDMTSVRIIGWGGAPASQDLVEKMSQLKVHLFTNYG